MKKIILLTAIFIAMAMNMNAQITNSGFENWTAVGNYENPDGWATMNSYSTGSFYSCQKSADPYPVSVGTYSIKITNNTSLTQLTGGWGMAITKAFDYPFKPAFPISGHPNSLTGYFKYISLNNDSLMIKIVLFNNGAVVANKDFYCGVTTVNWTSFTIPILNYTTADSATIMLSAFTPNGPTAVPKGNSSLKVDNLNFDNLITTGISDMEAENKISVYPNPGSETLTVTSTVNFDKQIDLKIFNTFGQQIFAQKTSNNNGISTLDISEFAEGIYFLRMTSDNRTLYDRKIIIAR